MTRWTLTVPPAVEDRVLGMDRRLLKPTLGALLVVLLWSVVMPAIDRSVDAREVTAGTRYDIGPASFVPAPGWVLIQPPSPVGESTTATVFSDGLTFRVKGGKWHGSAQELLDRVVKDQKEFLVEGPTLPVRTSAGTSVQARRIHGPDYVGLLLAFVDVHEQGVTMTIKGPVDASEQLAQPVAAMIRSLEFETPDA